VFRHQQLDAFQRAADTAGDDLIRFVVSRSQSVFDEYHITSYHSAIVIFRQVGRTNCLIDGYVIRLFSNLTGRIVSACIS